MRLTKIATGLWVGLLLLAPVAGWGMVASNSSLPLLGNPGHKAFRLFFGASVIVENGDMTYTIQGAEDGGWKSVLAWPIQQTPYLGGTLSASFQDRWQLNAGVWKNMSKTAGTMTDKDWIYTINRQFYSIYGELDAPVDAMQVDLNLRYDVVRGATVNLGPVLGYAYKHWQWTGKDGYQSSNIDQYNVGPISGTAITYEEKLKIPYLGVAFSFAPENSAFGVNLYMHYSPFAQCDDIDDHVFRYKESTGQTKGSYFAFGGDVLWKFKSPWSVTGKINYATYNLTGEQQQYFYGGKDPAPGTRFDQIDMTVEGHQFSFGLMFGYEL